MKRLGDATQQITEIQEQMKERRKELHELQEEQVRIEKVKAEADAIF